MSRNLCTSASVLFRGFPCSLFLFCTATTDVTDIFVRTRIFMECHGISAHLPPWFFRGFPCSLFLFCTDLTDLSDILSICLRVIRVIRTVPSPTSVLSVRSVQFIHLHPCYPSDLYRPTQPHPFSRRKRASRTSAPRCKQTDWCTSSVP